MKTASLCLFVGLFLTAFGCDQLKDDRIHIRGALASDSILVIDDSDVQDLPSDTVLRLDSLALDGRKLHFSGQYVGGCVEHDFQLFGSNVFGESEPPIVMVWLAHDAKGDSCEALPPFEAEFNLRPLEESFRSQYGADGRFLIDVRLPRGPYGSTGNFDSARFEPLLYTF